MISTTVCRYTVQIGIGRLVNLELSLKWLNRPFIKPFDIMKCLRQCDHLNSTISSRYFDICGSNLLVIYGYVTHHIIHSRNIEICAFYIAVHTEKQVNLRVRKQFPEKFHVHMNVIQWSDTKLLDKPHYSQILAECGTDMAIYHHVGSRALRPYPEYIPWFPPDL